MIPQVENAKESQGDTLICIKRSYLFLIHYTVRLICIRDIVLIKKKKQLLKRTQLS